MQCDILDNLYDNWNVVHSLNNSKVRGCSWPGSSTAT